MIEIILIPTASLAAIALVLSVCIVVVSKKFHVSENPLVKKVTDLLPGINCGACGYAGCAQLAEELVREKDPSKVCPAADSDTIATIGETLGISLSSGTPLICTVRCQGTPTTTKSAAPYHGIADCWAALQIFPGIKLCSHACIGLGSCIPACPFDALSIVDGLILVDSDRCTGCQRCIDECPVHVLEMVPRSSWRYHVACGSTDKGSATRKFCTIGCIGCRRCEKECPADAITVENNLAHIDQERCVACDCCREVCPTGSIIMVSDIAKEKTP